MKFKGAESYTMADIQSPFVLSDHPYAGHKGYKSALDIYL